MLHPSMLIKRSSESNESGASGFGDGTVKPLSHSRRCCTRLVPCTNRARSHAIDLTLEVRH